MNTHAIEYTDLFNGEANYGWVRRYKVTMPELTHYGYDGSRGYNRANALYGRELMRRAKALCALTGMRGERFDGGGVMEFRPTGLNTVLIVHDCEDVGE